MLYLWLKYIHILSSTILFGTGIGTACVMLYGHFHRNLTARAVIYQYVVTIDWLFTGISGVIQLFSGLAMVYLAGYSLFSFWLLGSLIGYSLTGTCWFIVVYLQIKLRDMTVLAVNTNTDLPKEYTPYFRWWFILGWPAFLSLLLVFYLMVIKPVSLNVMFQQLLSG